MQNRGIYSDLDFKVWLIYNRYKRKLIYKQILPQSYPVFSDVFRASKLM